MTRTAERPGTVELEVKGMTCGSCAARVQKALSRTDGVDVVHVNFATRRATVEGAALDVVALRAAAEKAGYELVEPALPLAAVGLLNPIVAGAAMGLSSVSVVTNSVRLRRFR